MLAYYTATLFCLPLSFVLAASFQTSYTGLAVYADQHGSYRASVSITVKDPATGNQTNCRASWTEGSAPSNWFNCDSPTFSFKIDQYQELNSVSVEMKHQYKGKGKKCVSSSSPDCTTSRAYAHFDTTTAGYEDGCSAEADHCGADWSGVHDAAVFSSCKSGCGLKSGAN